MADVPDQVSGAELRDGVEAAGVPTQWLEELHYHRGVLTVTHCRVDLEGRPIVVGRGSAARVATVTTTIHVDGAVADGAR